MPMRSMSCPKCGAVLQVTGRAPESKITCACGNVTTVPRQGTSRKRRCILVAIGTLAVFCPYVGARQEEGTDMDTARRPGKAITFAKFPGAKWTTCSTGDSCQ
jgi:hypothetical protein